MRSLVDLVTIGRNAKRALPGFPLTRSNPIDFVPRHCAGPEKGIGCLHQHPGEGRCACGQAVIGQAGFATIQVRPLDSTTGRATWTRHAVDGCRVVTPASEALRKAGA